MEKEVLLVWKGHNEKHIGRVVETDERYVVYFEVEPYWVKLENEINIHKRRIEILRKIISDKGIGGAEVVLDDESTIL